MGYQKNAQSKRAVERKRSKPEALTDNFFNHNSFQKSQSENHD
jgi:hypothetical protein